MSLNKIHSQASFWSSLSRIGLLTASAMAAFCLGCQKPGQTGQPGQAPGQPVPPSAAQGPGSGGGGDYRAETKLSAEQVREAIRDARRIVPFVLNHFESVITNVRAVGSRKLLRPDAAGDLRIPAETFRLLFPWPKPDEDAQGRWIRTQFRVEAANPCYDGDGVEKAASAFPLESVEICVSVPKIQALAIGANVVQRVAALLIHELSHKMGVTDHVLLEQVVLDGLPANPAQVLKNPVGDLARESDLGRGDLALAVDHAIRLLGSTSAAPAAEVDWSSACYDVAAIAKTAKTFGQTDVMEGVSLSVLRPIQEAEKEAIHVRADVFKVYCSSDNANEGSLRKIFGDKDEKQVGSGGTGVLSIARGTWRRPRFHDAERLRAELQDLRDAVSKVNASAAVAVRILEDQTL